MNKYNFSYDTQKAQSLVDINTGQPTSVTKESPILHGIDEIITNRDKKKTIVRITGWILANGDSSVKIKVLEGTKEIKFNYELISRPDLYVSNVACGEQKNDGFALIFPIRKFKKYKIRIISSVTINYTYTYSQLNKFADNVFKKNHIDYIKWKNKHEASHKELKKQRNYKFDYQPLISIVVPLFKTDKRMLTEMILSVKSQTYTNWELCLSDGSGKNSPISHILNKYKSNNIKIVGSDTALSISENTNNALSIATGDYIGFMDHDDCLAPNALYEYVKCINTNRDADLIYSDEDKINENSKFYFEPFFKPDFNLDLLRSTNYICHFTIVSRSLLSRVGYLNKKYDGAQDYDFVLRCSEHSNNIYHIPKVLYHWRAHGESTAEDPESKKYAYLAGKNALEDYIQRQSINADVLNTDIYGIYRIKYHLNKMPLVSIIVPNKDHIDDLDKCLKSIYNISFYKNIEVIVVENNSTKQRTLDFYNELITKYDGLQIIKYPHKGFNYSKINNFAIPYANGDFILFLNNDVEIINDDCISELLSVCQRKDVGAVGAKMFFPDNTIQHAGITVGIEGVAAHNCLSLPADSAGYFGRAKCLNDVSAVTAACLMTRKKVLDEIGYFDENLSVTFNDVDLCLKMRQKRYLIVYDAFAQLIHFESKSRGQDISNEKYQRFLNEVEYFKKKWHDILEQGDPYYNPNLTLNNTDFSLKVF